jgi:Ni/Fe-hydrogenase subunit HybB-like protein
VRSILAFLAAPILAALIPMVRVSKSSMLPPLALLLAIYLMLLTVQFIIAFPLRLVAARHGRQTLIVHTLIGMVATTLPILVATGWTMMAMHVGGWERSAITIAVFAAAGAVMGALYWLMALGGKRGAEQRKWVADLDRRFH